MNEIFCLRKKSAGRIQAVQCGYEISAALQRIHCRAGKAVRTEIREPDAVISVKGIPVFPVIAVFQVETVRFGCIPVLGVRSQVGSLLSSAAQTVVPGKLLG